MTEAAGEQRPSIRIGTAERNAALAALDAHLEAGRLDAMEYGDRSAHVAEARTADEITPLFADLPAPHPDLPGAPGASAPAGSIAPAGKGGTGSEALATRSSGGMDRWGPRVAAVMPFVAVALAILTHWWVFFLLIPAAGVLFAGSRGERRDRGDGHGTDDDTDDGHGDRPGDGYRDVRDERRRLHDESHRLRDERREHRRRGR